MARRMPILLVLRIRRKGAKFVYTVTAGVFSTAGFLLWSEMYIEVLLHTVLKEVMIIGFAKVLAVIVVGKRPEDIEVCTNEANISIKNVPGMD